MMYFNGLGRPRRRVASEPREVYREPALPTAPVENVEDLSFGWHASSLDLKLGCQVSEESADSLPGELLDSLFGR